MKNTTKPFLKWAGGKTQLLNKIEEKLPTNINSLSTYIEPFVGAGSVFFYMTNNYDFEEYIINDINEKLINVYLSIRDDVESLIKHLSDLQDGYTNQIDMESKKKYFLEVRDSFNSYKQLDTKLSAKFIFLNKTCFNGLYRENSNGKFNVPFGNKNKINIFEQDNLMKISKLLNLKNSKNEYKVKIYNKNYKELEYLITHDSFVYLDPPYKPITKSGFNQYNKSGFNDNDQIELCNFYKKLDSIGSKLMLSNSDLKKLWFKQ